MDILPPLRQQRLWLAIASLAVCLPWLATAGSGQCLLRADLSAATVASAQPSPGHCPRCCPPTAGAPPPASAPQPAGAAFCCEAFKACLPLDANASALKRPASSLPSPDASVFLVLFASVFPGVPPSDALPDPGSSRPVPPGAFLRTVARRCFPSHAPPRSSAPLS